MNARVIHDQTKTKSRDGGKSLVGGCSSWPTPGRVTLGQDSKVPAYLLPRRATLGGGVARPHFIRGWYGSLNDIADAFRLRAAGLREEQIGALLNFGGGLPSRTQALSIDAGLSHPKVEPAHQVHVLSSAALNDRDRDTKEYVSAGIPFWKAGNVFR